MPAPPTAGAGDGKGESGKAEPPSAGRHLFLDVFRGATVAGMILVNSRGTDAAYPLLLHAAWHGWTLADLVFPSFLVIVGVSLAVSLSRRVLRGEDGSAIARQAAKRALIIYAFGMLINLFTPTPDGGLRFLGVLPRIAFCSLAASLLFLRAGTRTIAATTAALLAGYWALLTFVPVPGFGSGDLSAEGNLASYLDRLLLGGHLSDGIFDSEGLLSNLPALANTLMGVLAGKWLLSAATERVKVWGMLVAGAVLAGAGLLWGFWFPINKQLWTSSFALFTGGAALAGLALTIPLSRLRGAAALARPFEIFGLTALLSYMLSGFLYDLQRLVPMTLADGTAGNLRLWLVENLFAGWLPPAVAALAYSLLFVLTCLGLMTFLHHRKISLKV